MTEEKLALSELQICRMWQWRKLEYEYCCISSMRNISNECEVRVAHDRRRGNTVSYCKKEGENRSFSCLMDP